MWAGDLRQFRCFAVEAGRKGQPVALKPMTSGTSLVFHVEPQAEPKPTKKPGTEPGFFVFHVEPTG